MTYRYFLSANLKSLLVLENRSWAKSILLLQAERGSLDWNVLILMIFIFNPPFISWLLSSPRRMTAKQSALTFSELCVFLQVLAFRRTCWGICLPALIFPARAECLKKEISLASGKCWVQHNRFYLLLCDCEFILSPHSFSTYLLNSYSVPGYVLFTWKVISQLLYDSKVFFLGGGGVGMRIG